MTINEALVKHNFITKVLLSSEEGSLSKDLKIKVMKLRIELSKVRRSFDEDTQSAIELLKPEGFEELQKKEDRTQEETEALQKIVDKINIEYNEYVASKGKEEISIIDITFTEDEYYEIVEVNSDKDVEINGSVISAPDFLEVLYSLFVA